MTTSTLRKTLRITYYTAITIAASAMVVGLFALGHTETFSTTTTFILCCVSGVSAIVAGVLQWVGLPVDDDEKELGRGKKSSRHST